MPQSRQLVAIMFTDIVGYTSLMGNNERKAFEILSQNRQIQKPIIEQFNGRWIKELGDGVMASFNSVSDAVYAAVKIQQACNTAGVFQLRIGIHLGEVVFEDEDVFGDGVNIASRIQALTPAGSIWVSESVHSNVANKDEINTEFVKVEHLKNVKEPIRIYQVKADGVEVSKQALSADSKQIIDNENTGKGMLIYTGLGVTVLFLVGFFLIQKFYLHDVAEAEKSIAVLPFENLSNDKEQEYFSEGITEDILNHLTKISGLDVRSRNSTLQYKRSLKSIREIGSNLNVLFIVAGSVQKSGNKVRITAKLIDSETERQLWSETFTREMDKVLEIQSEIALSIAETLKGRLTDIEKESIESKLTYSSEAYDLYLKGMYSYRQLSPEGVRNGINYFSKALELDSSFSFAYSGIANALIASAAMFIAEREALDALELAKPYLDKALELDKTNVDAHTFLGFYFLYNDWDFVKAEEQYLIAVKLNPGHPDANSVYADYLNFVRRHKEALKFSDQQLHFDSFYPNPRRGISLFYLNRSQEALDFQRSRLGIINTYWTYDTFGFLALNTGNYDEAIGSFSKAIEIIGRRTPRMLGWMGAAYAHIGKREMAMQILNELIEQRKNTNAGSVNFFIAVIYSALGMKNDALTWLRQAYQDHDMEIPWLISEPQFYNLHSEREFIELARKVGFPDSSLNLIKQN